VWRWLKDTTLREEEARSQSSPLFLGSGATHDSERTSQTSSSLFDLDSVEQLESHDCRRRY